MTRPARPEPRLGSWLGRLAGGGALVAFAAFVAMVASMTLGFHIAQKILSEGERPGAAKDERILQGEQLRASSNELLRLASEYMSRITAENPASESFIEWTRGHFIPSLNAFRQRMQAGGGGDPALGQLARAADRLAAMAGTPADEGLRRMAVRNVLEAADSAEDRIGELGVSMYLSVPRERAHLGAD